MRTPQLAILDDAWRRSHDRREPHLWLAAAAGPLAWIGSLVGMSANIAVIITVAGGIYAGIRLDELQRSGDRSWQRSWFLSEATIAMSLVCALLIAVAGLRTVS